ncbi:MAG TPA: Uma2 family endonuclease [Ktedonobacteraceae bacterium]|nr:Uma2 family endonuclease [Ktedonobacteraceae bacterium]
MEEEIKYYYDSHATEKDRMGQPSAHSELLHDLWNVLKWPFHEQTCAIYGNLNFYQTSDPFEYPEEPDLAIIKGIAYQNTTRSYRVGKSGPAPHVIFEVASDETWKIDLEEKPARYAHMGVQEYFAYDPYEPPLPESGNRRLFGWQLDPDRRIMREMPPASDGSLWSQYLESRLVSDGYNLRLYDDHNQMRLTGAEEMARQADELRRETDALARQTDELNELIERTVSNKKRIQVYSEKLRSMGIDPDQII